jgi:low affinity Fe/Cu permease
MINADGTTTKSLRDRFGDAAQVVSRAAGHPIAFVLAVLVVVVWAVLGPVFDYSDTWQLVINTGTTIVTFLMVFLIQNTQNRDTLALHLKLSELVFAVKGAEDRFADLENLTDEELEQIHKEFCERASHAHSAIEQRRRTVKSPATSQAKPAAHRARTSSKRTSPRGADSTSHAK